MIFLNLHNIQVGNICLNPLYQSQRLLIRLPLY